MDNFIHNMETTTHLFYIYSNSHALISYQIINRKKIKKENVKFLVFKGAQIVDYYKSCLIKTHIHNSGFIKKLKDVNNEELSFLNNNIVAYVPYRWAKNLFFFDKVEYFEEGIDVLQTEKIRYPISITIIDFCLGFLFFFISELLFFNKKRNFRVYVRGEIHFRKLVNLVFKKKTRYYGLIKNPNLNSAKNIIVTTLKINQSWPMKNNIAKGSNILILDPILTNCSFKIFEDLVLKFLKITNFNFFYIQFHPTDKMNHKKTDMARDFLKSICKHEVININLDYLCTKNIDLNLYGVASSLLIYSNLFGQNNSYSLYPFVYKNFKEYSAFLNFRGRYEDFCRLLEKSNVKLIN